MRQVADARNANADDAELGHSLPVLVRRLTAIATTSPSAGVSLFVRLRGRDGALGDLRALAELGELAIALMQGVGEVRIGRAELVVVLRRRGSGGIDTELHRRSRGVILVTDEP